MAERSRGILSQRDRDYLLGEMGDITDEHERQIRYQIRKRVLNALIDFWILDLCLKSDDLNQIFDPDRGNEFLINRETDFPQSQYTFLHEEYRTGHPLREQDEPAPATTVFEEAMTDVISFLYRGSQRLPGIDFEQVIERGLTSVEREHGKMAGVEISLRPIDVDAFLRELGETELTREEIGFVIDQLATSRHSDPES